MINQKQNNYQKQLDSILSTIQNKPSLLLHACCGPCSSYVLEYLSTYFEITVLFYNPNIYPEDEYNRRLNELELFYSKFPPALLNKIKIVKFVYNPDEFYKAIRLMENPNLAFEKEKGERCRRCYEFRLKKTYEYAYLHNFDYFCTTLSISPFKDAQKINKIGANLTNSYHGDSLDKQKNTSLTYGDSLDKHPKWLASDFKKKNGFKRSLELSKEYGLYRQEYCGCIYSKNHINITLDRNKSE